MTPTPVVTKPDFPDVIVVVCSIAGTVVGTEEDEIIVVLVIIVPVSLLEHVVWLGPMITLVRPDNRYLRQVLWMHLENKGVDVYDVHKKIYAVF